VVNDDTLAVLRASIVAGSANNQLADARHGLELQRRNLLYAPDYVINAGGVIVISHEGPGYDETKAFAHVALIHDTLLEIFQRAETLGIPRPHRVIDGTEKAPIKQHIRELKAEREEALRAGDKDRLRRIRHELHRDKQRLRRMFHLTH